MTTTQFDRNGKRYYRLPMNYYEFNGSCIVVYAPCDLTPGRLEFLTDHPLHLIPASSMDEARDLLMKWWRSP